MAAFTGRVQGSTIDLDAIPNAPFEGQRVRVVLSAVVLGVPEGNRTVVNIEEFPAIPLAVVA